MGNGVGRTSDLHLAGSIVKAITVDDTQVLQRNIAAPEIQRCNPPVIGMIATPCVPRKGKSKDRLVLVFPFEDQVILLNEYLFPVRTLSDKDDTRRSGVIRQTVD